MNPSLDQLRKDALHAADMGDRYVYARPLLLLALLEQRARLLDAAKVLLPRVGWHGVAPSGTHLYQCECCGAEHEHFADVPHRGECPVGVLAAVAKECEAAE